MFEQIVKRYAEILTKGDVYELFKKLEKLYGTIVRACEKIGIERKTFYHWKNAKQINNETKAKILKVALEEYPIDTLEFLAKRSRSRTREILELLIEFIRREILEEENYEKVKETAKKAEKIINEFSIPLTEYLRREIAMLIEAAYTKGIEIKIKPHTASEVLLLSVANEKYKHLLIPADILTSATTYSAPSHIEVSSQPEAFQAIFQEPIPINEHR